MVTNLVRLMFAFSFERVWIIYDHPVDDQSHAIRLFLGASAQKSGISKSALAMNSRRTSPVGAITAHRW
jgi:hypothetical protein